MIKIIRIILVFLFMQYLLYAHEGATHQYIIVEAYKLLEKQVGPIPELKNYIGTTHGRGNLQFQSSYVVGGAWAEDQEDAVYRIGYKEGLIAHISGFSIATLSTLLGFPYGIPASLVGAAYANEKLKRGLVSATHFWDADNSNTETDNVNFSLSNTEFSSLGSIGPYPNAFKKAKAYLNGGFIFVNKFVTNNNNLAYGTYFIRYYYEGLINLYKTGKIYCYGMYDVLGRQILPEGWVTLTDDERKGLVYNILGRIAHLLADMSVPAHVHNDEHGLWEDRYEKKMNVEGSDPGFAKYWNADNINGSFIDPYQCTDQIYGLMYGTNQITDQFASNRYNGDKNYILNGFQGIPEWKTIIDNTVCNSSSANYSDADLTQIRDITYPYVIRATAGLLFWFATQTGQLQIQLPIIVNKAFEFDPSEAETVYGYLAQETNISVPTVYTKNGRQYSFFGWDDGINLNSRKITPYNNSSFTALYKLGTHVSNNTSTWLNNNQRKYVRTPNGWMHMVYESMGRVWYEASSDNGSTWTIMNGGKPIDNGTGKSPSIDWCLTQTDGYQIIIAFQEGTYIRVRSFGYLGNDPYVNGPECYIPTGESATANVTPNIAWHGSRVFMVIWKKSSGIAYTCGWLDGFCMSSMGNFYVGMISGTNNYSSNPAISTDKNENTPYFDVAWEQFTPPPPAPPTSSIKTCMLIFTQTNIPCCSGAPGCGFDGYVEQYPTVPLTVSSSAMKQNSKVSIISLPDDARICWIADFSGTGDPWQTRAVMCKPWTAPSSYWSYYYYCKSTSINKKEDNSGFYFVFSQIFNLPGWNDYNWVVSSNNLYDYRTINTRGRDVQLCSGSNSNEMFVTSFYPSTSPYYFQRSNSLASAGLSKNSTNLVSENRGIVIENNGSGIYYSLANLTLDGKPVNFVRINQKEEVISDTSKRINLIKEKLKYSLNDAQCFLVSEPFEIRENSKLNFNEYTGIGDSAAVVKLFGGKGDLSFNLELIDDATGQVIGTVKESKYDRYASTANKVSSYSLNIKGNKKKFVKVKITLSTNIEGLECSIINHYSDSKERNALCKDAIAEDLTIETKSIPTEYGLDQNYPNPFNPTTTINYQLSAFSNVTLKIYDVLGREVATLADGTKEAGYYTATFDASHLASGIYFAKLTAIPQDRLGHIIQVKKMLLTK